MVANILVVDDSRVDACWSRGSSAGVPVIASIWRKMVGRPWSGSPPRYPT